MSTVKLNFYWSYCYYVMFALIEILPEVVLKVIRLES
jgi:hypothetical protein